MHPLLKNRIRNHLPEMAARLLWVMSRLVRTKISGFEQVRQLGQVNFAVWHGDELPLLPWFGKINAAILVSQSDDGEVLARGARYLGYHIVRGSSSRGAVSGMIALIKAARQGYHGVLAVDGPQGPRHVCKPGIVRLSQNTGVPLLPAGVAVSKKFVFEKSWNKDYFPLPFCRQVLFFDKPLSFGPEKDSDALARYCRQVEAALHKAHLAAQEQLRRW